MINTWNLFIFIITVCVISDIVNWVFSRPYSFTKNVVTNYNNVVKFDFNRLQLYFYSISNKELVILSFSEIKDLKQWFVSMTLCNIVFVIKLK